MITALKLGRFYNSITHLAVWGNHSTTMVPDYLNALVNGKPVVDELQDLSWLQNEFAPAIAKRGGELIKKWGRSSAASTAVAAVDGIRALINPTKADDCFTSGVFAAGNPYGINEDIVFSMPCFSAKGDGNYEVFCIH